MRVRNRHQLTVALDLTVSTFNHHAELWPLGEVFEIEANVVRLGEVIQIAWVEVEEVFWRHGPY